jgi:hypothetical protein
MLKNKGDSPQLIEEHAMLLTFSTDLVPDVYITLMDVIHCAFLLLLIILVHLNYLLIFVNAS